MLRPWAKGAPQVRGDRNDAAEPWSQWGGLETRNRLLGRDATHVFIVPLRAPGGAVEAFRGIVLWAAAERLGGPEEAFRLFGQESVVKSRNHHKVLRRELDRVRALCRALNEDDAALLGDLTEQRRTSEE